MGKDFSPKKSICNWKSVNQCIFNTSKHSIVTGDLVFAICEIAVTSAFKNFIEFCRCKINVHK